MAARVFFLCFEVGGAAATVGHREQRIVTKATITLAHVEDRTPPYTMRNKRLATVRLDECRDAMKRGPAVFDAFEHCQQFVVVCFVVAVGPGITCRVDAGCTIDGLNCQMRRALLSLLVPKTASICQFAQYST